MLFFKKKKRRTLGKSSIKNFHGSFKKSLYFRLFSDLCLSRKWVGVKLFSVLPDLNYRIVAQNPKTNKIELFIPFQFQTEMRINKMPGLFELNSRFGKNHNFQAINIVLIDTDSTLAYYRFNSSLHKLSGPIS